MVATAIIGSSLIGGAASIFGAQSAADAQTTAANNATALQREMFNKTQENLQPYINTGTNALADLSKLSTTFANNPIALDQDWLESTPGYKWNLAQGNKSVINSMAARGLGSSGSAIRGGATFASGLADSTYQNQFSNELANRQFQLGAATTPVTIGESAAANLGTIAQNTGAQMGSNIIGAGNAQAGADIATGNAISGTSNALVSSLLARQLFSPPTAGASQGVYYGSGAGGYW